MLSAGKRWKLRTWLGLVSSALTMALIAPGWGQGTATVNSAGSSKFEIYGGYGYFNPVGTDIAGNDYPSLYNLNATASLTYFFTRKLGFQVEGAYFSGNQTKTLTNPNCATDAYGVRHCEKDQAVYTAEGGLVYRFPGTHVTPFVHVLGGGLRMNGPVSNPLTWGWGVTGGLGADVALPFWQHRLAVRAIQADYEAGQVTYGPLVEPGNIIGGQLNLKALKLSAGLVARFGGTEESEKREMMFGCAAEPATVYAGTPITITGSTLYTNAKKRSVYTWSSNGGRLTPSGETATVDTTGMAPGEYVVQGHLSQGARPKENASCTAPFTIRAPQPPTLTCSANPASVNAGTAVEITTVGTSPQNRPLTYSFTASAGQIAPTGPTAHLTTAGLSPQTITVTCNAVDDLGQSAQATTQVAISAPAPPPVAATQSLCSLDFARDKARPARVNNESKACLDDVALTLGTQHDSQLVIVGNTSADEKPEVAAERALNVRQYLTQEKGIEPGRVEVRVGETSGRTVNMTLVPVGATFADTNSQKFDETAVVRHGQAYGTGTARSATPAHHRRRARRRVAATAPVAQQ